MVKETKKKKKKNKVEKSTSNKGINAKARASGNSKSKLLKKEKPPKKIRPPRMAWLYSNLSRINWPRIHFYWTPGLKRLLITVCSLLAIVIVALVIVSSSYTVDTILVEGNTHYSSEEVTRMVIGDSLIDKNSLYLSMKYANKDIKNIPFIETLNVKILSPTSVKIIVYEKAMTGFVEYMGQYIYFDNDGVVVESSDKITEGIPQIVGMKFDHFVLNEPLPVEDTSVFAQILDVSQLLNKYEIDVDKLYFDDKFNITLYFGESRVKLGGFDGIDEKIIRLKAILPEMEGNKGVLHLENYTTEDEITTFEFDK